MTAGTSINRDRTKRAFCQHAPKWQRFQPTLIVPSEKASGAADKEVFCYNRQYSHVYSHRLSALKGRCWKQLSNNNNIARVSRVLELREDNLSQIVGTLVKEVNDPKEDTIMKNVQCRPSDQLFLEDESGRVALQLPDTYSVHSYCTGVVVGVQGTVDKTGTLQVENLVLPDPMAPPTLPRDTTNNTADISTLCIPHLMLVSSLLCGDPQVSSLPREMLVSFLQGHFTSDAAKVCRVIVLGGGPSSRDPVQGIKELDTFLCQMSRSGIPVDILPGKDDPTTASWPQRPLHSSLLPHKSNSVFCTPNPYMAVHGAQLVVGSDGVNVHDIQNHVLLKSEEPLSELQALEKSLEWAHICPTAPDSVPMVPNDDPMVMDATPHLYICGNASKFATSTASQGTRLVCVPKFSETGEVVLVNLENLKVELLRFEDGET